MTKSNPHSNISYYCNELLTQFNLQTREQFKLFRPGGLTPFKILIKVTKTFAPDKTEPFPAWQGMQYLYDMLTGKPKFKSLDNGRYPEMRWQKISEILEKR